MKRKISFSLGLLLCLLLLSLLSSDLRAQRRLRFGGSSGIIHLAPGEALLVTAASTSTESITFNFASLDFMRGPCDPNTGICKYTVVSQTSSGPIHLEPNEAASRMVMGSEANGIWVTSDSPNLKVNAQILDANGNTKAIIAILIG